MFSAVHPRIPHWKKIIKIGPHLRELWGIICVPGFFRHSVYVGYCSSYYGFRCRMGLCLRSAAYCNGTAECPDGSDELPNCQSELISFLRLDIYTRFLQQIRSLTFEFWSTGGYYSTARWQSGHSRHRAAARGQTEHSVDPAKFLNYSVYRKSESFGLQEMPSLKLPHHPHTTPPRWSAPRPTLGHGSNTEATPTHTTIPLTMQTKLTKQSPTNHQEILKHQKVCHDFKPVAGWRSTNLALTPSQR